MQKSNETPLFGRLYQENAYGKKLFDYIGESKIGSEIPYFYDLARKNLLGVVTTKIYFNISELFLQEDMFINNIFVYKYASFLQAHNINRDISIEEVYQLSTLLDKDSAQHPDTDEFRHAYFNDKEKQNFYISRKTKFLEFIYSLDLNDLEFRRRVKDVLYNSTQREVNTLNPYVISKENNPDLGMATKVFTQLKEYNITLQTLENNLLNSLDDFKSSLFLLDNRLYKVDETLEYYDLENPDDKINRLDFVKDSEEIINKKYRRLLKKRNSASEDYLDAINKQVKYVKEIYLKRQGVTRDGDTFILCESSNGYIIFNLRIANNNTSKLNVEVFLLNRQHQQIGYLDNYEIFAASRSFRKSYSDKLEVLDKVLNETLTKIFTNYQVISISKYSNFKYLFLTLSSSTHNCLVFPMYQQKKQLEIVNELVYYNRLEEYIEELKISFVQNGSVLIQNYDEIQHMKSYLEYEEIKRYEFELHAYFHSFRIKDFTSKYDTIESSKVLIKNNEKSIENRRRKDLKRSEIEGLKRDKKNNKLLKKITQEQLRNLPYTNGLHKDVLSLKYNNENVLTEKYCMVNYLNYLIKGNDRDLIMYLKSEVFRTLTLGEAERLLQLKKEAENGNIADDDLEYGYLKNVKIIDFDKSNESMQFSKKIKRFKERRYPNIPNVI
ncbi:hypothetical protein IL45_04755 [Nonlabens ulvanivorans]|uniref:Uncharacterized protein n=1 Tax=Nonlabens ulvanivorans TaxID=906888 RepID=A0A084JX42_NONUL|nr:hypothetical protein [Nonlabens ulvanivorans]KEZ93526.1 hypothetical protein IL45_04755 [Nonlabens ulvanivorans]